MSNQTNEDNTLEQLESTIAEFNKQGYDFNSNLPFSIEGKSEPSTVKEEKNETADGKADEVSDDTKSNTETSADKEEQKAEDNKDETKSDDVKSPDNKPIDDKKAKEEQRKERTWKSLQAERESLKAEMAAEKQRLADEAKKHQDEFQKQMAEFKALREELEAKKQEEELKGSPESYDEIAKDAEARGDTRMADLARQQAAYLRQNASKKAKFEEERKAKVQYQERQKWLAEAVKEVPELNDTASDYHKEAVDLLKKNPDLAGLPRGPWFAAQFMKQKKELVALKDISSKVSVLEKEKSDLVAQITALKKNLSPTSASTSAAIKNNKTEKSVEELEAELKEMFKA